eukprot:s967_g8.t1
MFAVVGRVMVLFAGFLEVGWWDVGWWEVGWWEVCWWEVCWWEVRWWEVGWWEVCWWVAALALGLVWQVALSVLLVEQVCQDKGWNHQVGYQEVVPGFAHQGSSGQVMKRWVADAAFHSSGSKGIAGLAEH